MERNIKSDRLVDEIVAAEHLSINRRTLQNWRVRKQGPRFVKLGKAVRYWVSDLNRWANAQASSPDAYETRIG